MEVAELNVLVAEADGVGAVLFSLEADGHLVLGIAVDHGVVLVVLGEEQLGVVGVELELVEFAAFVEADIGGINHTSGIAQVDVKSAVASKRLGEAQCHLRFGRGLHHNSFHRSHGTRASDQFAITHGVEVNIL